MKLYGDADGTNRPQRRAVSHDESLRDDDSNAKKKNEYIYSLFLYMLELVTCSGHRIADHRHEFRMQVQVLLHDRPQNERFDPR
jgi:hypothetical protein